MSGLSARLSAVLAARWAALEEFSGEYVEEFEEAIAAPVAAAVTQSQTLSAALLTQLGGPRLPTSTIPAPTLETRAPFLQAWSRLNQGDPPELARQAGQRRAVKLGIDVVTRASDEAFNIAEVGTAQSIVGWRRVPRGDTCRWCLTVSTQRYRSSRAASRVRHDGCDCRVVPIVGDKDPGQVINRPLLDRLKDDPDARYLNTA